MTSPTLRLFPALGLCLALALPAAAQDDAAPVLDDTGAPVALVAVPHGPDGDPGAYLAARVAEQHGDFRAAAGWFDQALQRDPDNLSIIEGALFARLNLGDLDRALALADAVAALDQSSQLADFARLTHLAKAEDYAAFLAALDKGQSIGPLFDQLSRAWAEVGEGRATEALAQFDAVTQTRGFEAFGLYHKALALALAGDFEGADRILSGQAEGPINLNRRGVIAYAQILSQLERNPDALALLDRTFGADAEPVADALRARLQAGEPVPFDAVTSARDGIAETFFTIAVLLNGDADPALTLMHARAATLLRPDHAEAVLLTAAMLEELKQYDLAVEAYAGFTPDHPAFYHAELGRAEALYQAGRKEDAVAALRDLAGRFDRMAMIQAALADMLRRDEHWAEAQAAYDAALALVPAPQAGHWVLFFSRAITKERQQQFDAADADFRRALDLNPGQPQVLNYLGYSLLERGKSLDEALGMIEAAVKAEPETGYILDSLAWGYFLTGRYQDALAPMEKASLLEPVDPTVTDHLGDVYWMNGRTREAEFQWHRALSFGPEDDVAARIRLKLDMGLDAVMAEEAEAGNGGNPGN